MYNYQQHINKYRLLPLLYNLINGMNKTGLFPFEIISSLRAKITDKPVETLEEVTKELNKLKERTL